VRFVWIKWHCSRVFSEFLRISHPNHYSIIPPYSFITAPIALVKQHFITSLVFNLGASSLTCNLAGYRVRNLNFFQNQYFWLQFWVSEAEMVWRARRRTDGFQALRDATHTFSVRMECLKRLSAPTAFCSMPKHDISLTPVNILWMWTVRGAPDCVSIL
jgi:hypothetical protein